MPNYKLTIQYDGTNFYGWQSQPSGNTIQDRISEVIERITQQKINLLGSGRTDSGVHALGQVANFKIDENLDLYKFHHALNSMLPPEISVKSIEQVHDEFHSRFDARKRSYLYLISKFKLPFYYNFSYLYPRVDSFELSRIRELSKALLGKHDFTSFCKTQTDTENKICTVSEIDWKEFKDLIIFRIEADRFLHGMVRTIVGTLLYGSLNQWDASNIESILKSQDRTKAGEAAPAKGLFLFKVKY